MQACANTNWGLWPITCRATPRCASSCEVGRRAATTRNWDGSCYWKSSSRKSARRARAATLREVYRSKGSRCLHGILFCSLRFTCKHKEIDCGPDETRTRDLRHARAERRFRSDSSTFGNALKQARFAICPITNVRRCSRRLSSNCRQLIQIRISFVWQMRPMAPLTTTLGVARLDAG